MRITLIIITLITSLRSGAQVFWSEPFNNGCIAACSAIGFNSGLGPWTLSVTGVEGADPNTWFVSCAENGNAVGACGSGCGANATLHLSAKIGNPVCSNDCGAAYDAGGLCGFFFCPRTNRRIESPTINCTGYSTISLNFNYIENGQGTTDNATVWYFDGATWTQIDDPPKTLLACGGQGIWAARTLALPASANNNPLVKIGFRWVNNDDGAGTDPSIAINDITLSVPVLPIELSEFIVKKDGRTALLKWSTMTETKFDGFSVERSENSVDFKEIGFVKGSGNSTTLKKYTFTDKNVKNGTYYYRLRSIDLDRTYSYSPIKALNFISEEENPPYYDPAASEIVIPLNNLDLEEQFTIDLISTDGKLQNITNSTGHVDGNSLRIPVSRISSGLYVLRLYDNASSKSFRLVISL